MINNVRVLREENRVRYFVSYNNHSVKEYNINTLPTEVGIWLQYRIQQGMYLVCDNEAVYYNS